MNPIISMLPSSILFYQKTLISCFFVITSIFSTNLHAQSTICAVVKIEIVQELTIERQAFEASLAIENTLADKTLENIGVVVKFTDENDLPVVATNDPNNTTADFFIRVNSLQGIADVSGGGVLAGGQSALATWLIIPVPGSSGGIPSGKLYFVGADFNYTLDGNNETITVAPDNIYVKPMPLLSLDYFLPRDVFADNPLTQTVVEPIEPFTLGVRVQNNGSGTANNLKIESAQPEIVENESGLLIDFNLINSSVQNEAVENSLLINFGDIASLESKVGRWTMTTSLSGRFSDFTADFTHADELGGDATSLLESVTTHTLVRDVLVDEPGRDLVKDFLADDIDEIRIYESDSTTSVVENLSDQAALVVGDASNVYNLSFISTIGFAYAELPDPFNGSKEIRRALRSDGKELNLNNIWFSKKYNRTTKQISYFINVFDTNTTGEYSITVGDPVVFAQPPLIQFIPLKSTFVGNEIGFLIEASDPNGTIPAFELANQPNGANFVDQANGTAVFTWTPISGQEGRYELSLSATDGALTSTRDFVIVVNPDNDTDGDGLLDEWELEQFGNLDRDGTGDLDGDGVLDIDEFVNGTNPNQADVPMPPQAISPINGITIATATPDLLIENSVYPGDKPLVYEFEVSENIDYSNPVDAYYAQPQGEDGETSWLVSEALTEDVRYYWRVRANDGFVQSEWEEAGFHVNVDNRLPTVPELLLPVNASEVIFRRPGLRVANSVDPDGDTLSYTFYIYSDPATTSLVDQSPAITQGQFGFTQYQSSTNLVRGETYYWRSSVTDSSQSPVESMVRSFTVITPPVVPDPPPSEPRDTNTSFLPSVYELLLEEDND